MTIFDYVVIGIVAASLLLGLWRGVVGELIALAAWVLAFFAAVEFGGELGQAVFSAFGADLRDCPGSDDCYGAGGGWRNDFRPAPALVAGGESRQAAGNSGDGGISLAAAGFG